MQRQDNFPVLAGHLKAGMRLGDILPRFPCCDMIRQMQIGKEATAMKIGFIGIGVMGESMARHLMEKGHSLTVYNRTKSKADRLLAEGAAWAESAGACAKDQDAVITIVGFPKDVEEVYLAAGGILDSARPGAYLIDMTTTSPALWQRIAAVAKQRGLRPLDAPVSGGDSGARNATLSIMVGGDEADFEACCPLFEAMGKNVMLTGRSGLPGSIPRWLTRSPLRDVWQVWPRPSATARQAAWMCPTCWTVSRRARPEAGR